jgi:exopolyphosphatase / guanosine-5'-triphosphate,3'-diphosphate pyrophosphatase
MSTCAVIDLGTNTFNLLIAEYSGSNYSILYKEELPVKLGEGGITKKIIDESSFKRGIEALKKYREIIRTFNTDNIHAFATSAIRSTQNGQDFVKQVFSETGIIINVIPGDEEAFYIYKGVRLAGMLDSEPSLIMDIGGGSTEFIIANNKNLFWKQSFDLGVSRLIQKFNPSDPVSDSNITMLCDYFDEILVPLFEQIKIFKPLQIIGCSGSFESFESMIQQEINPDKDSEIKNKIELPDFFNLCKILVRSSEAERYHIKGLVEMRIDTIVFAAIFVRHLIEKLSIKKILVSHYALKEGVLSDIINSQL